MLRCVIRTIAMTVCLAAAFATVSAVHGETPTGSSEPASTALHASAASLDHRQREGSRMDRQQGHFKLTGDRLTFHVSGSEDKYLGLENLAMERIAKVVSERHDSPEQLVWEVTGVFTEYRGNNYLLITHAIIRNESAGRRTADAD